MQELSRREFLKNSSALAVGAASLDYGQLQAGCDVGSLVLLQAAIREYDGNRRMASFGEIRKERPAARRPGRKKET